MVVALDEAVVVQVEVAVALEVPPRHLTVVVEAEPLATVALSPVELQAVRFLSIRPRMMPLHLA